MTRLPVRPGNTCERSVCNVLLTLAVALCASILHAAAETTEVRLRRPLQATGQGADVQGHATTGASYPPSAPGPATSLASALPPATYDPEPQPQYEGRALQPSGNQATTQPDNVSLFVAPAPMHDTPVHKNSTAASTSSYIELRICANSACGGSCADVTAAQNDRRLYLQYASSSCGFLSLGTQLQCCAQTCYADGDCPSQYYCQAFTNGQKYCYSCQSCETHK